MKSPQTSPAILPTARSGSIEKSALSYSLKKIT
jgi:hypothetical protein